MSLKEEFVALAKACGADLVGVAPVSRFAEGDPVFKILPSARSVIGIAFRILRGTYRGTEEGTTFYQYTTMAVENMEETVMPIALLRLSNFLEERGFTASPQRRNQTILQEDDGTNPEVAYDAISRGRRAENRMDFEAAAVKCGLGERGFHGVLLTDDFGPFVRYVFILTDAELEADPIVTPHLCDRCGECAKGCPGHAIDTATGRRDDWRCAAYYIGANGLKNPFMPPDAFRDFPDRLKIIAGEAEIDEDKAKKIIDNIWFYPPAQHAYPCSICGRACDTACYRHLEAKGALKRKFVRPFRSREEWQFNLSDFESNGGATVL